AQDEETCVVYGMPRAVVLANLADTVLPIDKISEEIMRAL
ncbi:MAG: chemotaxis protein CheB, partial [Syntrophorhabdus sp.]